MLPPSEAKPSLTLLRAGSTLTVERLVAFAEKVTGTKASPQEVEALKKRFAGKLLGCDPTP